ncbi:MAG: isoprenylcysteine carboxylmethyltransferase family protein [Phycisphaerales bacterium]|nr:isoprenylcysteine carboxylmethyltransferase family protein [Phycisphaerales bacterium]
MWVLSYAISVYVFFLFTFLYIVGFVHNAVVPRGVDSAPEATPARAILINASILALFAVQHTIMARPAFKRWLTRFVPAAAERSTFMLATCLVFLLMFTQWRSMPAIIWEVTHPAAVLAIRTLSLFGFGLALYASFLIDHFELFGLRQAWRHFRRTPQQRARFVMPALYRVVRHPLMLGFLIALWATPVMTVGHLLLAGLVTVYIQIGIRFEERDLTIALGPDYLEYQRATPMLLPRPGRGDRPDPVPA